jgi:tripartite-type tricarboxylate transporter receptor subunit TctC
MPRPLPADVVRACAAACLLLSTAAAALDAWPSRPLRLVVPAAPGGAIDIVARVTGERLTGALGKQVVVDNRAGADGTIGLDAVAKAAPDGYTLAAVTDAITVLTFLHRNLPFDPEKSFAPITLAATQPRVLAVHASMPAASFREFVALAKAKPGSIAYGSGSPAHRLTAELLKKMAGIDLIHVPYKGGAHAAAELTGGQVPSAILGLSPVLPQARAGKVRMLAVTSASRSALVPNVPTLAESGLNGFDVYEWIVFLAPANTPRGVMDRLNGELTKVLALPAVRERLEASSLEAKPGSPGEAALLMRESQSRWAKLIAEQHLRLDAQ